MTNNVEREKIHDPIAYKLKTYVLFRLKIRIISTQNVHATGNSWFGWFN